MKLLMSARRNRASGVDFNGEFQSALTWHLRLPVFHVRKSVLGITCRCATVTHLGG